MRLRLLSLALLPLTAYAATDYQCLQNCTNRGYMYQYCQSQCSYPDQIPTPKRVDYACVNDCTAKGYMYNYCLAICSY